jgi:hypothetical protein
MANDSAHASQAGMAPGLAFPLSPIQIIPMHASVPLATQPMPQFNVAFYTFPSPPSPMSSLSQ